MTLSQGSAKRQYPLYYIRLHYGGNFDQLWCSVVSDSGRRSVKAEVEVKVKFKVIEILPGQNSIGPNIMGQKVIELNSVGGTLSSRQSLDLVNVRRPKVNIERSRSRLLSRSRSRSRLKSIWSYFGVIKPIAHILRSLG